MLNKIRFKLLLLNLYNLNCDLILLKVDEIKLDNYTFLGRDILLQIFL